MNVRLCRKVKWKVNVLAGILHYGATSLMTNFTGDSYLQNMLEDLITASLITKVLNLDIWIGKKTNFSFKYENAVSKILFFLDDG